MTSGKTIKYFIILIFCGLIVLLAWLYVPYFVVDYQYEQLIRQNARTKEEVENILFLFKSHRISIEDSLWATEHYLQPGEYCLQYLILNQPVDIVYNSNDEVISIYSSYE